jgi:iron-sulfur cluster repair protein YtfE (RIC family)
MSHACTCSTQTDSGPAAGEIAERTVAEVSKHPGALEVFERLGVNHCCGAHLSLREAAAAAGVSLDELLRALGGVTAATR